jgi:thioesterase domain-containing protein
VLGASHPVYGVDLNSLGVPAGAGWDAYAKACASAISAAVEAEEVCLGGWSMGGLLAVDVARHLGALGRKVGRLALLDAVVPDVLSGPQLLADDDALEELFERDLRGLDRGQAQAPGGAVDAAALGRFKQHARALAQFRPSSLEVPLTLVLSEATAKNESRSGFLVWALLARAGMTTLLVPGDHYSVVNGPGIRRVAKRLQEDCAGPTARALAAGQFDDKGVAHAR